MNIALVGPGIMEIPPKGWGAVESLIWDYATELDELGHEGVIINTPDRAQIIRELSEDQYDFIHVHYDVFYDIMDYIWATRPAANWQSVLTILTSTNQTDILMMDTIRYISG